MIVLNRIKYNYIIKPVTEDRETNILIVKIYGKS